MAQLSHEISDILRIEAEDPSLSCAHPYTVIATADELRVEVTASGSAPFNRDVVYEIKLKKNATAGAKEHFERLQSSVQESLKYPNGNILSVLRHVIENTAHTDVANSLIMKVYSPTLGGIELDPISPLPAFLKQISRGEEARDKMTGLLPPAFLLDENILHSLYQQMGADIAVVSMDIQGLGALNEVGLGKEIDSFLKKLPYITENHFNNFGRVIMTREGGDEFLFMVKMTESGEASAADRIAFQDALEDYSLRIREEVKKHFANCDPKLLQAAEEIRRARLGSNTNHEALGVMLPYVSARYLPYDERTTSQELQTLFVKCRDENDKEIFDLKKHIKAGNTTYLNTMMVVKEVDPTFPLKEDEKRALNRLHHRSEKCKIQFENAASEEDPYMRAFHFHMSRMFASVEPLIPEACFRLNRAEDALISEFHGSTNPCRLNVLMLDVDRFGKWNTLLGSLGADVEVMSNMVLKKVRDTLPYSIRFRERGGRLLISSRYTFDEDEIIKMVRAIEAELTSLFIKAREEFDSRAINRKEKTWHEILEDDAKYEEAKHKILYEAGIVNAPWEPSAKKDPGSIAVKGMCVSVNPNITLEKFGHLIDMEERKLKVGELRLKPLIDRKDTPSRSRHAS